ncbi:MAG: diphosphomevalonate decarboxylase [Polyangiaceae bacterium]|nr:diphosphomevalonate decarboxylase [Polyangiaceae bacterium]
MTAPPRSNRRDNDVVWLHRAALGERDGAPHPVKASSQSAVAIAHPNIALAKYWGKRPYGHNLPAVPSLSVTLAGMATRTKVAFDDALAEDVFVLNGSEARGESLTRVSGLLDRIRKRTDIGTKARVESANDFPTASGLASSASAFAALAVAASAAAGLDLDRAVLSDLARRTSVSAARSVLGGFVELRAGKEGDEDLPATEIAAPNHWDVAIVVAVTREGPKDVGSSEGMKHTMQTSPYTDAWIERAPALFERVRSGVIDRDLSAIGPAVEQSALMMHAAAIAADPGILYFTGATVEAINAVRKMRKDGLEGYLTIDAGPHVKVLTRGADAERVAETMRAVPGVLRTIVARPGPGAHVES